jgi:flavin-dependent dehydrogenase
MHDLTDLDLELVEVYQAQEFAPGFFGWVIPMGPDSAKVGLGTTSPHASTQLDRMLADHPVLHYRTKDAEIHRKIAGRIPPTGPVRKTYGDNILLVGDVAGQTKPTTGGGVIIGGMAAQIAGRIAAQASLTRNTSARDLQTYQTEWQNLFRRNLWLQRRVRNYMNALSDNDMNRFFNILDDHNLLPTIEKYGHVDNQGLLALRLLLTLPLYPYYIRTFPKLLQAIFRS